MRLFRNGTAAVLLSALVVISTVAPAGAVDPRPAEIICPSARCELITTFSGDTVSTDLDGQGHAYVTAADGRLLRVNLSDGATATVAGGLGNLRGLDVDGVTAAYVGTFDGDLLRVDLRTGEREVLARGLGPIFGVARAAGVTYVGSLGSSATTGFVAEVRDGLPPRVITTAIAGPISLALDGSGGAYVSAVYAGSVVRLDLATGATTTLLSRLYEPLAVRVLRTGRVVVLTGGAQIITVDPAGGKPVEQDFGRPGSSFALDDAGDGYVLGGGALWRVGGLT